MNEAGSDCKSINAAHGFMINITDSTYLVALNVCANTLGFTKPLSVMLQGTSIDVIAAYSNTEVICRQLKTLRTDCVKVFADDFLIKSKEMAKIAGIELCTLRVCPRQTKRNIVPSSSAGEYYK